jgi:hypothetical protein
MTHSPHLFDPALCRRTDLGCLDKGSGTTLQWLARTPCRWVLGPGSRIGCSPFHTEKEREMQLETVDYVVVTSEQALGMGIGVCESMSVCVHLLPVV